MQRMLLSLCLLALCGRLAAQPAVRTETDGPGGIRTTFILEKKDRPGTLTLFFTLYDVYNISGVTNGTTVYEIAHNGVRFLTLRSSDEAYGPGYRYSYRYYYGRINPPVDTTFVYRMPCATGKPVRVLRTVHVVDKYTKPQEDQQELGLMFLLEKGDTVYAMRRGVVTEVEKPEKPISPDSSIVYTSESLNLRIEQPDGSIARYICFDPDGLFVEQGDDVLPGTPLGRVGTYDGEHYHFSVQVYRYVSGARPSAEMDLYRIENQYFKTRFATSEGVVIPMSGRLYTPVADDAIVTREMSKKELRRWEAGGRKMR